MLVGDVEVPYEHPPLDSEINFFFYRFLCSFWWDMLPEANHMQYCQNIHFQYGRHEKMLQIEKIWISVILTITDKQNLHINVIVESYNEISYNFYSSFKGPKYKMAVKFGPKIVSATKSTDVPFSSVI